MSGTPNLFLSSLPKGRSGLLLAVAITFLMVILAWMLFSSLIGFYETRKENIEDQRQILLRTQTLVTTIPALQEKYEAAKNNAHGSTLLITETSDETALARLQESVHDAADGIQVVLSSQEPLPITRDGSFERLSVRISLTASWADFIHFLDALAQSTSPRLLVNDVQLQVASNSRIEDEAVKGRMIDASLTILALRDAPPKRAVRNVMISSSSR
ncbi:type II secretion system protein GspM [Kozakia baliensis]|uniref:type II secretion system protein GspM n=1 Tax=Kozakia baliensis TaxID=153496 RepID=UPI0009F3D898|nr:type II secretion system protein GspM [Kozakia baliensis]GEL64942.1 hypothetical protein KBA01_22280 [Kozakia baliensis]